MRPDHDTPPPPSPAARLAHAEARHHIVRVIAASPDYLAWLHDHNARILDTEADRFADRGQHALAATLRERAQAHRNHATGPFTRPTPSEEPR